MSLSIYVAVGSPFFLQGEKHVELGWTGFAGPHVGFVPIPNVPRGGVIMVFPTSGPLYSD